MTYILLLTQQGGCDYTIGCGLNWITLEATTEEAAVVEAKKGILEHYSGEERRCDTAQLLAIAKEIPFDLNSVYREEADRIAAIKNVKAAAERKAEYERLKKEFEGK